MQMQNNKTVAERIVHAVGYEVIAISILAPIGAWVLNRPMLHMGALSLLLSTIAMVLNMTYNALFDYFWPTGRFARGLKMRVLHAVGFEAAFILIGVPVAAYVLDMSILKTFLVELGFFAFILPYTMAYNWAFDVLQGVAG